MNKKTLRKMFIANETEFYNILKNNAKYKDIDNRLTTSEEILINCIDKDQFDLLDDVLSLNNEMMSIYVEEAYIRGFSDAVKLHEESLR